jgi:hypothetical protein
MTSVYYSNHHSMITETDCRLMQVHKPVPRRKITALAGEQSNFIRRRRRRPSVSYFTRKFTLQRLACVFLLHSGTAWKEFPRFRCLFHLFSLPWPSPLAISLPPLLLQERTTCTRLSLALMGSKNEANRLARLILQSIQEAVQIAPKHR